MATLTVFTPTYNRAHTLERTYRSLCSQTCRDFEWLVVDDGSTDGTDSLVAGFIAENIIPVRYIYKENGGLYTGYNTAYANITSELCCCVDSDDFMPDDAVETIIATWRERGGTGYAGVIGLDFDVRTGRPLGGYFPPELAECFFLDLYTRRIHRADTKVALRTDLMRAVAPMTGFRREKFLPRVHAAAGVRCVSAARCQQKSVLGGISDRSRQHVGRNMASIRQLTPQFRQTAPS